MYLVFPVFTAKPISLSAFNNTSVFLSIFMISPTKFITALNYDNEIIINFNGDLNAEGNWLIFSLKPSRS